VFLLGEKWRYRQQQRLGKEIGNCGPNKYVKEHVELYLKVQLGINAVYKSITHCRSCHANWNTIAFSAESF